MHSKRQGRAATALWRQLNKASVVLLTLALGCPSKKRADDPARPASSDASVPASASLAPPPTTPTPPQITTREIGPYEVPFEAAGVANAKDRHVYFVVSRTKEEKKPARLLANLHGVCNPPGYACGYWVEAAASTGFLVCPSGNSRCGGAKGPPTWTESFPQMDSDLEKAIALVESKYPGEISREGSILTGFSMGAYAAYMIAQKHPGRWPYLILNESDVPLERAALEAAGVKAVALIAGEIGSQVAGERKTATRLEKQGYPARLWVMKGAGHHYSADIDNIMAEAIAFVLSAEAAASANDAAVAK